MTNDDAAAGIKFVEILAVEPSNDTGVAIGEATGTTGEVNGVDTTGEATGTFARAIGADTIRTGVRGGIRTDAPGVDGGRLRTDPTSPTELLIDLLNRSGTANLGENCAVDILTSLDDLINGLVVATGTEIRTGDIFTSLDDLTKFLAGATGLEKCTGDDFTLLDDLTIVFAGITGTTGTMGTKVADELDLERAMGEAPGDRVDAGKALDAGNLP